MIKDKTIVIKNIYYMLTYAFRVLHQTNYEKIEAESFDRIDNLFAAIIDGGLTQLLKQGLYKEYQNRIDDLNVIRGKIDISGVIKNKIKNKKSVTCDFDELTIDNSFNQIIKSTLLLLLKPTSDVEEGIKIKLRKKLVYFQEVGTIADLKTIRWDALRFHNNNKIYELIITICYFVINGFLQTNDKGKQKVMGFTDDNMAKLFEKFILEYFRKEHPEINTSAPKVNWAVSGGDEAVINFLPTMQTDITLSSKKTGDILIIDAKYYSQIAGDNFGSQKYHSSNMYQIFTYVKNMEADTNKKVSGVLVYAKTEDEVIPTGDSVLAGNSIGVRVLDLSVDFSLIRKQLDSLITDFSL